MTVMRTEPTRADALAIELEARRARSAAMAALLTRAVRLTIRAVRGRPAGAAAPSVTAA